MPIKPGKCPQTDGTPNCPPFSEKDCIEVFKVFDQCAGEEILGRCVKTTDFYQTTIPDDATVSCTVVPNTARCFFIGFGAFNPPFFRPVLVQNQLDVEVTARNAAGAVIGEPFVITLQGIFQSQMWAPPGTLVQCQVIAVGDCSCNLTTDPATGDQLICCQVKVCKEIQIKALVKLLVPSYGFCELDPCTPVPQPFFPCPPEQPLYPPQRCQEDPVVILQEIDGSAITGTTVTITRAGTTVSAVTDGTGTATFTTMGAIVAGDVVQFTDPASDKLVSFTVPPTFTDQNGTAHDSNTVCSIRFQRTSGTTFNIFIDGIQNGTVDP